MPRARKQGISETEAAAKFGVTPRMIAKWKRSGWVVTLDDGSIDADATAEKVDANRNPFVGGAADRGHEPKPKLSKKAAGQFRVSIEKRRRGNEHLPSDITVPVIIDRTNNNRLLTLAATEGAAVAVGKINHRMEKFGLTKGQFSAAELLHAVLMQTGPADVVVATWTVNTESIAQLAEMHERGELNEFRIILDSSLKGREPEYCQHLVKICGNERIRTTRNHSKWMVIRNDTWNVVVRTSMNFGTAPRLETFEISDDPGIAAMLLAVADELWQRPAAFNFESDGSGLSFDAAELAALVPVWDAGDVAKRRLSILEAAEHFHVSKNSVSRGRNAGWLTFDADGCAPADRLDAEWRAHFGAVSTLAVEPLTDVDFDAVDGVPNETAHTKMTITEARRRREVANALKAELELAQAERELIPRGAAEKVYCDVVAKVRANIEALPSRLADSLVGLDAAHIKAAIEREVCSVLSAISEVPPNV